MGQEMRRWSAQAHKINRRFGDFMRNERERRNLSIEHVAQWLCLDSRAVHRWEAGLASPPAETFYRLVCLYGEGAQERAIQLDIDIQIKR